MKVIVHVLENASFDSGRAEIKFGFLPVLDKIAALIDENSGSIMVSGHTDNVPISNERFRSNWELSSARAVTVVHAMLSNAAIDQGRFLIQGYADSKPLVANDTSENRAQNRRVELVILFPC